MTTETSFQIDNLTYDLITLIHEKSKGLEAYQRYLQDAQGNQQARQLFQHLQEQEQQSVQQLLDVLKQQISTR